MSFKITQLLYSFISVIIALFFVFIGIISLMLPWFPGIQMTLATFVMEDSITIFFFGFSFLLIGAAFIAGTIWGSRRRYYRLKTGPYSVQISEAIFLDYLETYWKQIFPNTQIPCNVKLARNQVRITADLPFIPLNKQKEIIEKMQQDVTDIFTRLLGYRANYYFSVSFNEEKS